MAERHLTITLQPDWKGALRAMAQAAKADEYQGEGLNLTLRVLVTSLGHKEVGAGRMQHERGHD